MIRACLHIWQAVKEILCNDSPEGHLPEELDESELVDTKNVLSYSFRSIHESRYVHAILLTLFVVAVVVSSLLLLPHFLSAKKASFLVVLLKQLSLSPSFNASSYFPFRLR